MCYLLQLLKLYDPHQNTNYTLNFDNSSYLRSRNFSNEIFHLEQQCPESCIPQFICPCFHGPPLSQGNPVISNLFRQLQTNFSVIKELQHKMENIAWNLEENHVKIQDFSEQLSNKADQTPSFTHPSINIKEFQLYQKLFENLYSKQKAQHKYKIILKENISRKLYKERNFQLKVSLVTVDGKTKVANSNMMNICVGVFDCEGNWVTNNRLGQSIIKGKTQIELLKGSSTFEKLFFRDISGSYDKGKLNMVVYVKPFTLQFENHSYAEYIDWQQVYPLFIRNVKVLSRKKNLIENEWD